MLPVDPSILGGAIDAAAFVLRLYDEFKSLPQALEDFKSYVTHVKSVLEGLIQESDQLPGRAVPIIEDIEKQLQCALAELRKHRRRNVAMRTLKACLSDTQKQFVHMMATMDRYVTLLLATRAPPSSNPRFAQSSMQKAVQAAMDGKATAQDMKRAIIALDTAALAADGETTAALVEECSRFRSDLCSGGSYKPVDPRMTDAVMGVSGPIMASRRELADVHTRVHWLLKQKKSAMEQVLAKTYGSSAARIPSEYLAEMRNMMQDVLASMLSAQPAPDPLRPVASENMDRGPRRRTSSSGLGLPHRVFSLPAPPAGSPLLDGAFQAQRIHAGPFPSAFGEQAENNGSCGADVKFEIMSCPVLGLPYCRRGPLVPRILQPCGCTMSTKAINDLIASAAPCPQCQQAPDRLKSRRCEVDEAAMKVVIAKREHRLSMMSINIRDIPEMNTVNKTAAVIGKGAEATVYKCTWLDTPVAVKEIITSDLSVNEMTELNRVLEITALAAATSDNITQLYGVAWGTGAVCVVSELCECSLQDYVKQRQDAEQLQRPSMASGPSGGSAGLPVIEVLQVGAQVASALSALHQEVKTWHLDVSPGNILLNLKPLTAKLTDFGIAKRVATARWMTRAIGGTATFSPPETIMSHNATATSDVYSLAATLVFAATGQPISSCTEYQMVEQVKAEGCLRLPAAISGVLRPVLQPALAYDPKARPSICEFRDMLMSALRSKGGRLEPARAQSLPARAQSSLPSRAQSMPPPAPAVPTSASLQRLLSNEQASNPRAVRHLCYTKRTDIFRDLAECVCLFTSLTHLSLKDCALGVSTEAIQDRFLSQLPTSLEELDLEKNYLGPKGTRTLTSHLHRLRNLKVLNVARNALSDQGAQALAAALPSVGDTLLSLRAKNNDFRDAGYRALAECLPRMLKLKELQLDQALQGPQVVPLRRPVY